MVLVLVLIIIIIIIMIIKLLSPLDLFPQLTKKYIGICPALRNIEK